MESLLNDFNSFFEGTAKATIVGNRLEITIGSQTLLISLPQIVGGWGIGDQTKDSS